MSPSTPDPAPPAGRSREHSPVPVRAWRRLHLGTVLGVGALAAALVAIVSSRTLYADSLHCLVAGREIWRHGLPRHDHLTFLGAGRDWTDQQWLAHLAFYGTWVAGGYRAVAALSAGLAGLALGVLAATIAARGTAPLRVGIWTIAAFAVVEVNSFIRAQSFALLAFALALALLVADDDRRPALGERPARGLRMLLLLVLLAWGNLHGSVVAFAAVVVATWGWRAASALRARTPRLALEQGAWVIGAIVAPLVTPYGLRIVDYYRHVLGSAEIRAAAAEWQPWTIANPFELVFGLLLASSILALGLALGRRLRPNLPLTIGTVAFAIAGLQALRSEVWFAFFAAVLLGDLLTRAGAGHAPPTFPRFVRWIAIVVPAVALVLAGIVVGTTTDTHWWRALPRHGATDAISLAGEQGNICGDEDAGTTVEWLAPQARGRVAFDVRYEVYSEAQLHGIFRLLAQRHPARPDWLGSCTVVVASKRAGHDEFLRTVRRLRAAYVDELDDALVVRVGAPPATKASARRP